MLAPYKNLSDSKTDTIEVRHNLAGRKFSTMTPLPAVPVVGINHHQTARKQHKAFKLTSHNMRLMYVYEEKGVKLQCGHCSNVWTYRGHADYYTSCTKCRWLVRLGKNRVKNIALAEAKQKIGGKD